MIDIMSAKEFNEEVTKKITLANEDEVNEILTSFKQEIDRYLK